MDVCDITRDTGLRHIEPSRNVDRLRRTGVRLPGMQKGIKYSLSFLLAHKKEVCYNHGPHQAVQKSEVLQFSPTKQEKLQEA